MPVRSGQDFVHNRAHHIGQVAVADRCNNRWNFKWGWPVPLGVAPRQSYVNLGTACAGAPECREFKAALLLLLPANQRSNSPAFSAFCDFRVRTARQGQRIFSAPCRPQWRDRGYTPTEDERQSKTILNWLAV